MLTCLCALKESSFTCLIMSKFVKSSICHPEAIPVNVLLTPRNPSLYLQGCGGKKSYDVHALVIILIELHVISMSAT